MLYPDILSLYLISIRYMAYLQDCKNKSCDIFILCRDFMQGFDYDQIFMNELKIIFKKNPVNTLPIVLIAIPNMQNV
ncbi:hypothetical protein BpHYR1_019004 [Brachionus plicatilis]|uniref:Uncharacterized protein n=1 Tax=Brachionus plicatilis TaxID=10195 RepID=A0A3M7RR83_BRAPC|nr:hypothetical protein BpHYR1_019004 [Brachionus plicatilis]